MPLPQNLFCGTSGWSYQHWNGVVYPKPRPRDFHALEFLARYFDAVEINTSFYQPLRPEISRLWIKKVEHNPKFLFCAKLNRRFTHDRVLDSGEITAFKEGLWPLIQASKLGCLLMQFPWTFRFTEENRAYLIKLARKFGEFPLAAELRHSSWSHDEGIGALIDHRIGFCNIDQAPYTKAMPPREFVTSPVSYVRLHGRNPRDWTDEFGHERQAVARHNYLYAVAELREWRDRVNRIHPFAALTFVFMNNDAGGKAVVNAIQMAELLGDDRCRAPEDLARLFPLELAGLQTVNEATQPFLFAA
jgi:uncharacterized protein YecE (DUF72 family)